MGGLRADLASKSQGKECFESLLCPLSLDYSPQLSANKHFPWSFCFPCSCQRHCCPAHPTPHSPFSQHLSSLIPSLHAQAVLLHWCRTAPACSFSVCLPWWGGQSQVLPVSHAGFLPAPCCSTCWDGLFLHLKTIQVSWATLLFGTVSHGILLIRSLNKLSLFPYSSELLFSYLPSSLPQDLNWQIRSANFIDTLGTAAVWHHIPTQFVLTCEQKIWMSMSLSMFSICVKKLSPTYSRNWITCIPICYPSTWSPTRVRAWDCKIFPSCLRRFYLPPLLHGAVCKDVCWYMVLQHKEHQACSTLLTFALCFVFKTCF